MTGFYKGFMGLYRGYCNRGLYRGFMRVLWGFIGVTVIGVFIRAL